MDVLSEPPRAEKHRGEPESFARCVEAHLAPANARTWMCGPVSDPVMAAWRETRCESDHRVRCLAFLVPFWHCAAGAARTAELAPKGRRAGCPESCQKGTGSPQARRSSALQCKRVRRARCWIPACAGMTSEKTPQSSAHGGFATDTIPTQPSPWRGGLKAYQRYLSGAGLTCPHAPQVRASIEW